MNSHVAALFEFTRSRVSEKHIADYSPSDPGYESYVQHWTKILRTGVVPRKSRFELSEVIGLTGWSHPSEFADPARFREYRRFTSAVAVMLLHLGNDAESVRVGNYLARDLLIDCDPCAPEHFELVRKVFPAMRDFLAAANNEEEYPFFTFGALILAQVANDFELAAALAAMLIEDEHAVRRDSPWCIENAWFLLGLTTYDQLRGDWLRAARGLSNPTGDENMQLVLAGVAEWLR